MRNLILILLSLFMFSQLVFSDFYLREHIDRPWNDRSWINNNSNIYQFLGNEYWLPRDITTHDHFIYPSLDSLELEKTDGLGHDEKLTAILADARSSKSKADFSKTECESFNYGAWTFTLIYEELVKHGLTECLSYGKYWKGTMENSISSVEYSNARINKYISNIFSSYQISKAAGFCDSDYSGVGASSCKNAGQLLSITTGQTDFDYANLADIAQKEGHFIGNLKNPAPDTKDYYQIVSGVWGDGGTIAKLGSLDASLSSDMVKANDLISQSLDKAKMSQGNAQIDLQKLAGNQLNLITTSSSVGEELGGSNNYQISSRYSDLLSKKGQADKMLADANFQFSRKQDGYAKSAALNVSVSESLFLVVSSEVPLILADAENAVPRRSKSKATLGRRRTRRRSLMHSRAARRTER